MGAEGQWVFGFPFRLWEMRLKKFWKELEEFLPKAHPNAQPDRNPKTAPGPLPPPAAPASHSLHSIL